MAVIICSMAILAAGIVLFTVFYRRTEKAMETKLCEIDKFQCYYELLSSWLGLRNRGIYLREYFKSHNYKKVAIYGMGDMGLRLYEELEDTGIEVSYAIDKRTGMKLSGLKVAAPDNKLLEVDVIVVTPVTEFIQIRKKLEKICDYKIISLEDIIYFDYEH